MVDFRDGAFREYTSEQEISALNAGISELIHFTDGVTDKDGNTCTFNEFGACKTLIAQNINAAISVKLTLNASIDGTGAVKEWGNSRVFQLDPGVALEIEAKDSIPFYNIVVTNLSGAANLSAKDICLKATNKKA